MRKSFQLGLYASLTIVAFSSCAVLFPDRTAPKSKTYQVAPPSDPWHKLAVGEESTALDSMNADLAYENPDSGAIISLNSLCRKYYESSLETLTNNLVRGIENRSILDRKEVKVNGVDALDTLFEGTVDKVKLNIRTIVLTKNSCTYDFIFVLVPKKGDNSRIAFENFVSSFQVE